MHRHREPCPHCGGSVEFSRHCGADVCVQCGWHVGLCRCFCGWAADGGDGRAQLVELGETLEPDEEPRPFAYEYTVSRAMLRGQAFPKPFNEVERGDKGVHEHG